MWVIVVPHWFDSGQLIFGPFDNEADAADYREQLLGMLSGELDAIREEVDIVLLTEPDTRYGCQP